MAIVEKVFYTEKKSVLDNDALKMVGYKYESGATLGMKKDGYYIIIKADESEFEKEDIKQALRDTEEIKDDEKEEVLKKIKELEESAASGFAMFG